MHLAQDLINPAFGITMTLLAKTDWNPREYHSHSSVQREASLGLIQQLKLTGRESILDVGCGAGSISYLLSQWTSEGSVLAVDISSDMIAYARNHYSKTEQKNLSFSVEDGQLINYPSRFDIIYSSFAMQWFKSLSVFFQSVQSSLKLGGKFAGTVPLGVSDILLDAVHKVISRPRWSKYFEGVDRLRLYQPKDYRIAINQSKLKVDLFTVDSQSTLFSSREDLASYISQWLPYLKFVPHSDQAIFFREIMDIYCDLEPPANCGRVGFSFARLDLICSLTGRVS